jgi:hypothetical protein
MSNDQRSQPPGGDSQREHVKSAAAELSHAAQQRAREALDEAKRQAAGRADEIAAAVDAATDEMESADGGDTVEGYSRSFASLMRQLAGGLRERDVDAFASELAGFARRNPGTFLAGSVALGFGLSRFLKASAERPAQDEHEETEDVGHEPQSESRSSAVRPTTSDQPRAASDVRRTQRTGTGPDAPRASATPAAAPASEPDPERPALQQPLPRARAPADRPDSFMGGNSRE